MKYLSFILLVLFPFFGFCQVFNTSLITRPTGSSPSVTTSLTSLSGFSTNAGTASTSQSFTVSGTNLTANATVTAPTGFELSVDNTTFQGILTITRSGSSLSGQPVTIYARITSSASAGTVNGNISITSSGAVTKNVAVSGTVNSTSPTLNTSVSSLSQFTTTTGTASSQQNFTVSGSSLTAGATITAPTGFEVSLDNSSYATTKSISQAGGVLIGQPNTIYVRIAAATSVGSYSGNVVITSTGASNVNVAVTAVVSSTGSTVAKFSFGKDASMSTTTGWTLVYGNPSSAISVTDPGTGWTIQTYSTNWQAFAGGNYASNVFGANTGSFGTLFPATVVLGSFLNSGILFNTSTPNYGLHIDNLPAGNYTVQILGSIQSSISNQVTTPEYHVDFGAMADQSKSTMNNQNNTGNPVSNTTVLSFTGDIASGEILKLGVFAGPGFVPGGGCLNAIIITKN